MEGAVRTAPVAGQATAAAAAPEFRAARFDVEDLHGARFTDCDLTGVTIRDGWLVNVGVSGYVSNVTVNGVDVVSFVSAELDRRHPEQVQLREVQNSRDFRAMWDAAERLWADAAGRAGRLPVAALTEQVDEVVVFSADAERAGVARRRFGFPDGAGRADALPPSRPAAELVPALGRGCRSAST